MAGWGISCLYPHSVALFSQVVMQMFCSNICPYCCRQNTPEQMLVGFVTARLFRLHECHPTDRTIIGLASK